MTFLVPSNFKIIKARISRFVVLSWPPYLPILLPKVFILSIKFLVLSMKFFLVHSMLYSQMVDETESHFLNYS